MVWIVQGFFSRRLAAFLVAFVTVACMACPAAAEIRIALRSIIAADKQTDPGDATAFEHALRPALAEAVEKARNSSRCETTSIDISREFIASREVEKMLQKKGYASKQGPKFGKIVLSDVVDGVVGFNSDGGLDYMVQVTNLVTNKIVARVSGDTRKSGIAEAAQKIAESIMEQACKKKPYRLQARYNDLTIDHLICDLSKPFSFNGSGKTAGIRFSLTPSGDSGGAFSLAGPAAGVSWSGSGNYTQTVSETGGTLNLIGTWRIKTPAGAFADSGTIPGKLTAFSSTQCSVPAD